MLNVFQHKIHCNFKLKTACDTQHNINKQEQQQQQRQQETMNSLGSLVGLQNSLSGTSTLPSRRAAATSRSSASPTCNSNSLMDYDDCVTKALQHETTATLQGCDDHQAALKLNDIPFVGRERDMAIIKESVDRFLRLNNSNSKGRRINNNGGDDDEDENDTLNESEKQQQQQQQQQQPQLSQEELPPKIISISGPAGSGKTALAGQVESLVTKDNNNNGCYFLRGKFDEFTGNDSKGGEAYSGLAMAMEEFAEQIVQRDLDWSIRRRIQEFLKGGESVLLDVFPGLNTVLSTREEEGNTDYYQTQQQANTATREESREHRSKRRIFFFQQIFSAVVSLFTYEDANLEPRQGEASDKKSNALERNACIVLVLDDIQWADQQSLDLISSLVRDPDLRSFLLITANRPAINEKNNLLDKQMKAWSSEKIRIQKHPLDNLCVSSIETLVASLLGFDDGSHNMTSITTKKSPRGETPTTSLARVVHQKTDGNPFFTVEFLRALVDQQLLIFSYISMNWKWDIDKIYSAGMAMAGRPLDLVIAKMKRLSQDQRLILLICSCLGGTIRPMLVRRVLQHLRDSSLGEENNDFSLSLALRNRTSDIPALETMEDFIRLGLMERNGKKFVFVHDLIRQAAMDFVSRDEVEWMRLRVGECILLRIQSQESSSRSAGTSEQYLFLGVDLCNGVSHLFDDTSSSNMLIKVDLALHNFRAGEKAMKDSLFLPALQYMKAGMKLLQSRHQIEEASSSTGLCAVPDKELLVKLLAGAAEASYCSGNYEDMKTYAEKLLREHDCEESAKIQVLYFKVLSAAAQELAHEALDIGYSALKRLGMATLPRYPKTYHVVVELLKTRKLLRHHTAESLQQIPLLLDEKRIAAMEFLSVMKASAAVSNQNFMICSFLKSVRWSVKYGLGKHSPGGFATYGMIINAMFQQEAEAIMYGDVALALANRMDLRTSFAETSTLTYALNRHWTTDMRTCHAPLVYAQKLALECGDIETVVLCLVFRQMILWCTAMEPLSLMGKSLQRYCALCRDFKNWSFLEMMTNFGLYLSRLVDEEDKMNYYSWLDDPTETTSCKSASTISTSVATRKPAGKVKDLSIEVLYDSLALQSHFLLGERREALDYAKRTYIVGTEMGLGTPYVTRTQFYRALVYLTHTNDKKKVSRKHLREASRALSLLEKWGASGRNSSVLHMVKLVKAEFARVRNEFSKAKELYASAIRDAESSGHIHDAAIGNERAAVFYLEYVDDGLQAAHHLEQSLLYFRKWGASAVVRYLLVCYGNSLSSAGTTAGIPSMQCLKSSS